MVGYVNPPSWETKGYSTVIMGYWLSIARKTPHDPSVPTQTVDFHRDYNGDPNIKALKGTEFIKHGSIL